ncbi:MAG: hypothetical protein LJE87_16015, partial [Deltaproteobacteria bacterium]|nr:hypothetical protein [Deltaproteobacteria bacterium]
MIHSSPWGAAQPDASCWAGAGSRPDASRVAIGVEEEEEERCSPHILHWRYLEGLPYVQVVQCHAAAGVLCGRGASISADREERPVSA